MSAEAVVDGCSPEPRGPVGSSIEPVRDALAEVRTHRNQLAATHGVAMVAVLGDLLTDVELRLLGAERRLAVELGHTRAACDRLNEWWREEASRREQEVDALAALLAEVDRRNRRSHSKPSKTVARARKLVDQYNLDHGA